MPIWIVIGVCAAVFVLCVAVAGARGVFDASMSDGEDDLPPAQRLPRDFDDADLDRMRFSPALWGYRPAEVDAALQTLRERLSEQSARVQELESIAVGSTPAGSTPSAASSGTAQEQAPRHSAGAHEAAGSDTDGPRTA